MAPSKTCFPNTQISASIELANPRKSKALLIDARISEVTKKFIAECLLNTVRNEWPSEHEKLAVACRTLPPTTPKRNKYTMTQRKGRLPSSGKKGGGVPGWGRGRPARRRHVQDSTSRPGLQPRSTKNKKTGTQQTIQLVHGKKEHTHVIVPSVDLILL